jgi:dipeptidyl aminopeptidase/acylaminoacyl peptidase
VNEEFRYAHLYTTEVKPADDTTRSVQHLTDGTFHITSFDWAPDGETIAFAHQPTPRVGDWMDRDLSTVPADSGATEVLVERPGPDWAPRYSPDGQTVAFISMDGERVWEGLGDVFTVSAEGGEPTALARTPNRFVGAYGSETVGWTAGGKSVLVEDVAGASAHVYAVGEGSARQATAGEGVYEDVSYSRSAGRLALTYQSSSAPEEVYVGPRRGFERRRLSTVNADVPKPEMGRTELVTWTGPEGKEIEGLLTYPVGYDRGRVPLVLHVHGGPAAAHSRSFTGGGAFLPPQVFAQRGYAMLRPNPRGSNGYGQAFREAVLENWGPGPYQDLMAGVDTAVEMRVAHPDSLAIMGGSYGGYMTAYAVTQTDRFQAASMGAGVSNLISMTGTTDIPRWQADQMGGEFWNRQETYEANSPIYHVNNVETPTQIIHGAKDERVPSSQGREFYRALKRQGVPTEFALYPRMGHGPTEPKYAMDFGRRMMDWFDEHLGRSPDAASDSASSSE